MIKRTLLGIAAAVFAAALIFSLLLTRDGALVTPQGEGVVQLASGTFEAFPLPDYAQPYATADYKSYFVEAAPGIKVHVLEVGSGYPLFLQHGNPTSGFLYRKVARALPTERVRVIMPTMVGLGFSSKVPASQHTLANHMRWIKAVLDQLQLQEVIYVGQDWGGPVGMGALALSPGLLKGAVAMNTGFTAPKQKQNLSRAHAAVKIPLVGEFLTGVVGSVFDLLPRVQNDPASMPPSLVELYARPLRESGNEQAPLALMRMVPDGPDHPSAEQMRMIEAYVRALDVPAELVWGINDPILGRGIEVMAQLFPNAPITETQAGHFLQEEVPTEIAAALLRVLAQAQNP